LPRRWITSYLTGVIINHSGTELTGKVYVIAAIAKRQQRRMADLETKEDKRVKPLIIFQFKTKISEEIATKFANAVTKAFEDGCLICDDNVNIIAFDDRGRQTYPLSPPIPEK